MTEVVSEAMPHNAALCLTCPGNIWLTITPTKKVLFRVIIQAGFINPLVVVKYPWPYMLQFRGRTNSIVHPVLCNMEHDAVFFRQLGNWEYIIFHTHFRVCMMSISLLPVESAVISLAQIVSWFNRLISSSILFL